MRYEISWSDRYDLAQKLEKIQKISLVLHALSACDECPSEGIRFLASEINTLSYDLSQVVGRTRCVGNPPSAFSDDSDAPI